MLTATLANAESTPVQTATPSFTGRRDMELDGALRALGMEDAFDMHSADFTGMGRSSLGSIYISTVLHSAYIELDAHGTRRSQHRHNRRRGRPPYGAKARNPG